MKALARDRGRLNRHLWLVIRGCIPERITGRVLPRSGTCNVEVLVSLTADALHFTDHGTGHRVRGAIVGGREKKSSRREKKFLR